MTAINVLIGHGEAHLFADTGHYDPATGRLDHLASKVFPLPEQKAALAWSGPSALGLTVADLCRRSGAVDVITLATVLPGLITQLRILQKFSAIVVGPGCGIAIEEGGRVHHLAPGSVVRSIAAGCQLDPDDLRGSAVRLMEEQRQSSGVVFGQCQYWRIGPHGCTMEVLHDWRDRPARITSTSILAAKIGDLEVDRINISPNAINSKTENTVAGDDGASVSITSDGTYPVVINGTFDLHYFGTGSSAYGNAQCDILLPGNVVLSSTYVTWSGSGGKDTLRKLLSIDDRGLTSETYSLRVVANSSGGGGGSNATVTVNATTISALQTLR